MEASAEQLSTVASKTAYMEVPLLGMGCRVKGVECGV
jgi:hypothetical protein